MKHERLNVRTLGFLADAVKAGRKCTTWTFSTDDGTYIYMVSEGKMSFKGPPWQKPKYRKLEDLPDNVKLERITVGYY